MKRLALALMGLALLSGCGIKGGLERPDPLWNRDEAVARDREQQQRDEELAARRAGQAQSLGTTPGGGAEPIPAPPR